MQKPSPFDDRLSDAEWDDAWRGWVRSIFEVTPSSLLYYRPFKYYLEWDQQAALIDAVEILFKRKKYREAMRRIVYSLTGLKLSEKVVLRISENMLDPSTIYRMAYSSRPLLAEFKRSCFEGIINATDIALAVETKTKKEIQGDRP